MKLTLGNIVLKVRLGFRLRLAPKGYMGLRNICSYKCIINNKTNVSVKNLIAVLNHFWSKNINCTSLICI